LSVPYPLKKPQHMLWKLGLRILGDSDVVNKLFEIHDYFSVIHFIYTKIRPLQGYRDM
jgi:hypothetical protein